MHILTTLRTLDRNGVNVWSVKFYLCRLWITSLFCQFGTASDALPVSARALPDIKWGTPVTVTGNCPVLNVLQPVSETAGTDRFRNPVDRGDTVCRYVGKRCRSGSIKGLECKKAAF